MSRSLLSAPVPCPLVRLTYERKDISSDIAPYLVECSYVDHLSGESDELEVRLEDADGRWRGPWYPGKGDKLKAEIGYAGEKFLPCGEFEIDEIGWSFPPDEVSIRALATGISTPSRTRKSRGYEKTTLAAVIRAVAKRLGLTPAGEVADIPIDRVTQYQESDLAFLKRLAGEYGHAFKVCGKKLIFQHKNGVLAAKSVKTLEVTDCTGGNGRDKLKDIPAKVKVKKQDAGKKALKVYGKASDGSLAVVGTTETAQKKRGRKTKKTSSDELKITGRGSQAQLAAKGDAALRDAELERVRVSLTLYGDPELTAGLSVDLGESFGAFSGKYLIMQARHEISRDAGYRTELDLARTGNAEKKEKKA
ncbi:phage late control D family protein [uncultured Bilophila sp.]|uniref:phage late control D family protein n=1 Tax=uncultured Bilophila sp. TaxID=529385 RepID=UPI0026DC2C32|nr:contractile injection system protein, VgrG/Pvc8 family [uncultured Bilophila sp.]